MAKFANQKTITIKRDMPEPNNKRQFLSIYTDALATAARVLTSTGFKLYLYFASNQTNYTKDYSPRHFANVYGVSYESARLAPQNLLDNHYLVEEDGKYYFYDTPQEQPETIHFQQEKRIFREEGTNQHYILTFQELIDNCEGEGLSSDAIRALWESAEVAEVNN